MNPERSFLYSPQDTRGEGKRSKTNPNDLSLFDSIKWQQKRRNEPNGVIHHGINGLF
jgi:hypothetical protein